MIRTICYTTQGKTLTSYEVIELASILKKPDCILWVDLEGESNGNFEPILQDIFNFHPLAIDDALIETHIPRVDDWGDYLYLVLRDIKMPSSKFQEIQIPELDIFLGKNYIVSYHKEPVNVIDTVWNFCQNDQRYLTRGIGFLFYHIVDEMVTQYILAFEGMEEFVNALEDDIFNDPRPETISSIFGLKRTLTRFRRTILPQREVLNKLARGDFNLIRESDRVYFRDVYDHMFRLQEINESLRDLVNGSLEIYLSVVNNRMNEVMKTLTIITTLFMPLSFLTGFFGMNFFQAVASLKIWTGTFVFNLVLVCIVSVPIGMYIWMKRRTWM